jgi:hypothetical protein
VNTVGGGFSVHNSAVPASTIPALKLNPWLTVGEVCTPIVADAPRS